MVYVLVCALAIVISLPALSAELPSSAFSNPSSVHVNPTTLEICGSCHGSDGNSSIPVNPNLAGQHVSYLLKQLNNFKSSSGDKPPLRMSAVMNSIVTPLSSNEIKALAEYFSKQKLKPAVARSSNLVTEGRAIWRAGDIKKGIPACAGCHGVSGGGLPTQYPALAGQHQEYLINTLKQFRDDFRTNDPEGVMRTIASKMSDQQISSVAEYAASLRR